jgi:hypothetical protein
MQELFRVLKEINEAGTTILLVEQNARMALQFASRGYVLEIGNIVLEGTSEELANNPDVKKAYLGGVSEMDLGEYQPPIEVEERADKAQEQIAAEWGRPFWLTVIAILQFIGGLAGIGLYVRSGPSPDMGALPLIFAVALTLLSVGLWQMREWGRAGTLIVRIEDLVIVIFLALTLALAPGGGIGVFLAKLAEVVGLQAFPALIPNEGGGGLTIIGITILLIYLAVRLAIIAYLAYGETAKKFK